MTHRRNQITGLFLVNTAAWNRFVISLCYFQSTFFHTFELLNFLKIEHLILPDQSVTKYLTGNLISKTNLILVDFSYDKE